MRNPFCCTKVNPIHCIQLFIIMASPAHRNTNISICSSSTSLRIPKNGCKTHSTITDCSTFCHSVLTDGSVHTVKKAQQEWCCHESNSGMYSFKLDPAGKTFYLIWVILPHFLWLPGVNKGGVKVFY